MNNWELYMYLMPESEKISPRQGHGNNLLLTPRAHTQVKLRLQHMLHGDYPDFIKKDLLELLQELQSEQELR